MKSLNSFLNPKRKENLKFVLSDAFQDEAGKPIQWEMRQITAQEGLEIQKAVGNRDYTAIMTAYVAEALAYPNMHDKELLEGLSKKASRPILRASDALLTMLTDAELASLISRYTEYNDLATGISELVDEVKN